MIFAQVFIFSLDYPPINTLILCKAGPLNYRVVSHQRNQQYCRLIYCMFKSPYLSNLSNGAMNIFIFSNIALY